MLWERDSKPERIITTALRAALKAAELDAGAALKWVVSVRPPLLAGRLCASVGLRLQWGISVRPLPGRAAYY